MIPREAKQAELKVDQYVSLIKAGVTLSEIGRREGVHYGSIRWRIQRFYPDFDARSGYFGQKMYVGDRRRLPRQKQIEARQKAAKAKTRKVSQGTLDKLKELYPILQTAKGRATPFYDAVRQAAIEMGLKGDELEWNNVLDVLNKRYPGWRGELIYDSEGKLIG